MMRRRMFWPALALFAGCTSQAVPASDASVAVDARGVDGATADARTPDGAGRDLRADAGPRVDALVPTACQATSCGTPTAIQSGLDLLATLAQLPWEFVGPYTSRCLKISEDFAITGELTVDAQDLKPPASCASRSDCKPAIGFRVKKLAGVSCAEADTTDGYLGLCRKLTLKNARVRFRAILEDWHPSKYNFVPLIEVVESCAEPCPADALRCAPNHTCFSTFEGYCRLCLAKDKQACPCLSAAGAKANDTECHFMVSGDVMCEGKCQSGTCKYTGKPGWAGCP
ncbi:MAG: hypothetical protein IT371_04695 [Deltaproteobacteria bacterium]|nr:hypothetical protein [Deltaproteobacteria bacterium]